MLSVILTILKIIGILLLILLGLVVLLLCEILWVPARYRIIASKYDEMKLKVNLSWLFRLAYFTARYEEGKLITILKIFGLAVYDSRKPKKKKNKKRKSQKKKTKKETQGKENKSKEVTDSEESIDQTDRTENLILTDHEESSLDQDKSIAVEDQRASDEVEIIIDQEKIIKYQAENRLDEAKSSKKKKKRFGRKKTSHQRIGMKSRIRQIITSIKKFFKKVYRILQYPGNLKNFISTKENQSSIKLILETIQKLLKHSAPTRIRGQIVFGFEDPSTTGKAIGALSVVYAYLNLKHVDIVPDFENARFEGKIDAKGRIYAFSVIKIVIRLLMDKNFKGLKNRWNQFQEE